jgi:hypothetical protein
MALASRAFGYITGDSPVSDPVTAGQDSNALGAPPSAPGAPPSSSTPTSTPSYSGHPEEEGEHFFGDLISGFGQEGFSGLWDMRGMINRQEAQRELKSRFDIVSDDFVGPRLPNQVTEAEFEQSARTFSDIRLNRGDIHFAPSANRAYRDGAMGDFANLLQTPSGRQLLDTLNNNTAGEVLADGTLAHHATTLRPYLKPDGTLVTTGARESVQRGENEADSENGKGVDTVVNYNPGVAVTPSTSSKTNPWWPARSDVILMHELTHAYYDTQGTKDSSMVDPKTGDGVRGDVNVRTERSEHQAAGLGLSDGRPISENAYRAQRAKIGTGTVGVQPGDINMPRRDYSD